jgi:hypothetical protein
MFRCPGNPVLLLLLLLLFVGLLPAEAGGDDVDGLDGQWRFITTGDYEGYVNGTLKVGRDAAGVQTCKLTVYQSEFGSAVERCTLARTGKTLVIVAEEVISSSVASWRREVFRLSVGEGDIPQKEITGVVKIVVDFPVRFTRKK